MMDTPVRENKIIPWETAESVTPPVVRRKNAPSKNLRWRGLGIKIGVTLGLTVGLLAAGTAVARRGGDSATERALEMVNVPETVLHTVGEGDSLWKLAGKYGNPQLSIMERLDNLMKVNGFSGAVSLYPGQQILLRVEHPTELAKLRLNRADNVVNAVAVNVR